MTLWPEDERRLTYLVIGVMLCSGTLALALEITAPTVSDPDPTISNLLLGTISLLLGLIVWVLKKGYRTLTDKIDEMGQRQQAFVVAVVQVTVETHPDMADRIMTKFGPLLQNGWEKRSG